MILVEILNAQRCTRFDTGADRREPSRIAGLCSESRVEAWRIRVRREDGGNHWAWLVISSVLPQKSGIKGINVANKALETEVLHHKFAPSFAEPPHQFRIAKYFQQRRAESF